MTIENLIELFTGKRVKLKPITTRKALKKRKKATLKLQCSKSNIEYLKL